MRCVPVLLLLSFVMGCAAAIPRPVRVDTAEGYTISFPGQPDSLAGKDGPVDFRIDAARTPEEARFEVAWFRFPQSLDAPERAELLLRVERGLFGGGARVVSRTQPPNDKDRVDLVLDLPLGRRGYYQILYPNPRSMLQVSAVGPEGGEWERAVKPFFRSLVVKNRAPLPAAPVQASLPRDCHSPAPGHDGCLTERAPVLWHLLAQDDGRLPSRD
ncbi:MAG: hypothetical protein R3B70_18545 [Polyangiaceae bacterium]